MLLNDEADRWGFDGGDLTVSTGVNPNGLMDVLVTRINHDSEGTLRHACHLGSDYGAMACSEGSRRYLGRFTREYGALHARDRVIREVTPCRTFMNPPAWSVSAHPITLSMLRYASVDASRSMPSNPRGMNGYRSSLVEDVNYNRKAKGLYATQITHNGSHLQVRGFGITDDRGSAFEMVDVGSARFLKVRSREMPATFMLSMVGMRIDQVVDHEALAEAGHVVIERCDWKDGTLRLYVTNDRVPLAKAPEGVDTSWLDC